MMWAVLAAALAAVFLLGGLRVGLRGSTPRRRRGPGSGSDPRSSGFFPGRRRKAGPAEEGAAGGDRRREAAPPALLSRRGLLELGRRLFPLLLEAAGQFRRKLQIDELRLRLVAGAPDPADAALRYGQANALLGGSGSR